MSTDELQPWYNFINRDNPSPESRTASANAAIASLDQTSRVLNLGTKGKPLKLHAALPEEFADIWKENSGEEIKRMIRLEVIAPKMPKDISNSAELTYYSAKCKEKEKSGVG